MREIEREMHAPRCWVAWMRPQAVCVPDMCRGKGIVFLSFPIPDRGVPDTREARHLAEMLAREIANGRSVAIHCRAGIGRSSLVAASVLVCSGVDACEALQLIKDARGVAVPDTEEQRDWVLAFGRAYEA